MTRTELRDHREAASKALTRLDTPIRMGHVHGIGWIVMPTIEGWRYVLHFPPRVSGPDQRWMDSVIHSGATRDEAIVHALNHAAQVAWSRDVRDDRAFLDAIPDDGARRSVESWIRWHRRYLEIQREHPDWSGDRIHEETWSGAGTLRTPTDCDACHGVDTRHTDCATAIAYIDRDEYYRDRAVMTAAREAGVD